MKIQYGSDFHMEIWKSRFPSIGFDEDADVLVFPGDISNDPEQIGNYLGELVTDTRSVIYVPGNHEYYHKDMFEQDEAFRKICHEKGIKYLDMETLVMDNVTFIGATLWTDYCAVESISQTAAMSLSDQSLNDHFLIRHGNRLFKSQDALEINSDAKNFVFENVSQADTDHTVAVTHHAPSIKSVPDRFKSSTLNGSFVNKWDGMIEHHGPDVWIHGHTHSDVDYRVGATQVVSSQLGYPGECFPLGAENLYKPGTIVLS